MSSLKDKFEEMIHLDWGEFVELEKSGKASVDELVLCSLVRSCTDTDEIAAIKLAFDRIDGLQETPIEINVPKFYMRYINAKKIEPGEKYVEGPNKDDKEKESNYDPATAKLRETLLEMRKLPNDVIRVVRLYKRRIEKGTPVNNQPKVKAVMVANLLKNVTKGKFRAIELVFDQIDGKLTRTITLLGGNDVYVDDYTTLIAPADSQKDEDGVYYSENELMKTQWLRGFARSQKGLEMLAEGLNDEYRE